MEKKEIYSIDGMNCTSCSKLIEIVINNLDEIEKANVNFSTEKLYVTWKNETDENLIKKTIENIGYSANKILSLKENYIIEKKKKEKEIYLKKINLFFLILTTIFILTLSMGEMIGISLPINFEINLLIQGIISLIVMLNSKKIYISGLKKILNKTPNMDSLISIATMAAFLQGIISMVLKNNNVYFESVVVILTLIKLGKFLEDNIKIKNNDAINSLLDLSPKKAIKVSNNSLEEIDIELLEVGDIVLVQEGMSIASDGIIIEGSALIDESMISGESIPVLKKEGDLVIGASINKEGNFKFKVTNVGQNTLLSKIIEMVSNAQGTKADISRLADKVSQYFIPLVLFASIFSFIFWIIYSKDFSFALNIAISVLLVACPCSLGLATPLAIIISTSKAAKNSILIKSAKILEELSKIDTIFLDKTGTITYGEAEVKEVYISKEYNEKDILKYVASIESLSSHPLAKSIVKYINSDEIYEVKNLVSTLGKGISGIIFNKEIKLGNENYINNYNNEVYLKAKEFEKLGRSLVFISIDNNLVGVISLFDKIKENSKEAIKLLKNKNIDIIMLTGDNETNAKIISKELNIVNYKANLLPEEKANIVKSYREDGKKVIMIGDGINDAIALANANIGISIGNGSDIAIESSDIVLLNNDILSVYKSIIIGENTIKNIKENLFWAFSYNIIGIPLAMGILKIAFNGPILDPMLAAFFMTFSSLAVLLNSLKLKIFN